MGHCFLIPKFIVKDVFGNKYYETAKWLNQVHTANNYETWAEASLISHLLEKASQIIWKISREVNIINHISHRFLKSVFLKK